MIMQAITVIHYQHMSSAISNDLLYLYLFYFVILCLFVASHRQTTLFLVFRLVCDAIFTSSIIFTIF